MNRRDILPGRMDGLAFDDDQTDTSARALLVIGDVSICWQAVKRAQSREMRLEDETIVKFEAPDTERAEQHWILPADLLPCAGWNKRFSLMLELYSLPTSIAIYLLTSGFKYSYACRATKSGSTFRRLNPISIARYPSYPISRRAATKPMKSPGPVPGAPRPNSER